MDYGMIGKIEKAKRYAEERKRISFEYFKASFNGENNPHNVEFENGEWSCGVQPYHGIGTHSG
jgi:hypothetical protein